MQMQLLPFLHVALTCSFVLALAYLLFILFSFLASSVIRASSAKPRRRRPVPRSLDTEVEWQRPLDRLQEDEKENERDKGEIMDAVALPGPAYELPGAIADRQRDLGVDIYDRIVKERREGRIQSPDAARLRRRGDAVGKAGNRVTDEGGLNGDGESRQGEASVEWDKQEGAKSKEQKIDGHGSSSTKLVSPQGSSSGRQRLPPTWSDLEKLVNMNSKKDLLAAVPPSLLEE